MNEQTVSYRLWVNADRTVLVRLWENGQTEFSIREPASGLWGPPIPLSEERTS